MARDRSFSSAAWVALGHVPILCNKAIGAIGASWAIGLIAVGALRAQATVGGIGTHSRAAGWTTYIIFVERSVITQQCISKRRARKKSGKYCVGHKVKPALEKLPGGHSKQISLTLCSPDDRKMSIDICFHFLTYPENDMAESNPETTMSLHVN